MDILFYILLACTLLAFYHLIYLQFFSKKVLLKSRLKEIESRKQIPEENKELSFRERIIQPLYKKILGYVRRVTPSSIEKEYQSLLDLCGLRNKMTVTNLLMIQILSMILIVLITTNLSNSNNKFLLAIASAGLFFYLPVGLLRLKGKQRQTQILQELPSFIDLIYVTVEAGLSFDLSLQKTLEQIEGPLVEEFTRTLDEITHGGNRAEAFKGLARRIQLEQVENFITSVTLAEEMGSNIGNVLRVQSQTMRRDKKQRLEEQAAKIPVKMTFPLVLFMFPSLFIVILGPAIINIMENLL